MTKWDHISIGIFLALACFLVACGSDDEAGEDNSQEDMYMSDYDSPGQKWGFMDQQGQVVIPAVYDQVSAFTEGLAAVNREGHWGYIDHEGNAVVDYAYLAAWPFAAGMARVMKFDGTQCIINHAGDTTCLDEVDVLYDFADGRARYEYATRFGYIDRAGDVIIDPIYEKAWNFSNGLARVVRDGKYGIIDTTGEFVIEPVYDRLKEPGSEYVVARMGGTYTYVTVSGGRMGWAEYLDATPFQGERAGTRLGDGWFLIDTSGKQLAGPFDHLRPAGEGMWVAQKNDALALVDSSGSAVTDFAYQQINNFSEGFAVYGQDGLWGYLSSSGEALTPAQYGLAWDFKEGMARAAFRDGIAFITPEGRIPFIPRCDELRDYSEGLAAFQER